MKVHQADVTETGFILRHQPSRTECYSPKLCRPRSNLNGFKDSYRYIFLRLHALKGEESGAFMDVCGNLLVTAFQTAPAMVQTRPTSARHQILTLSLAGVSPVPAPHSRPIDKPKERSRLLLPQMVHLVLLQ